MNLNPFTKSEEASTVGQVEQPEQVAETPSVVLDCPSCGGEGLQDQHTVCPKCHGTGHADEDKVDFAEGALVIKDGNQYHVREGKLVQI